MSKGLNSDLLHVLASFAGFRNAGRPISYRMQRAPPPPPPGHRGTYRVPTGILTRATHYHQTPPPITAHTPQRGAPHYTQSTAQPTTYPRFPPQPPLFYPTTHHRPHSTLPAYQHCPPSFATPPLPSDFVPSEQSWSSYWLRYLCHGHEVFPVFTKHISQAMLATELFSRLNHNKIDLDAVALAHCQGATPPISNPTKKQALAALADEFYEYMSGLIHETPTQNTASTDPQSNQRILQLEQQLAIAQSQLAASNSSQDAPTTPTKKRPPPPSQSPAISSTPLENPNRLRFQLPPLKPLSRTLPSLLLPLPAHLTLHLPQSPHPAPSLQSLLQSKTARSRPLSAERYKQPYQGHLPNRQNLTFFHGATGHVPVVCAKLHRSLL